MGDKRNTGRPRVPPEKRRSFHSTVRLNGEEQSRMTRLCARYQKDESAVVRLGLIALERNPVRSDE